MYMFSTFGALADGDLFLYKDEMYKVIPLIKVGACGCVPQWNAERFDAGEIKAFFHSQYEVEKVEQYRIHVIHMGTTLPGKHITVYSDDIPIHCDKTIRPLVHHDFIEYEPTDTWLLYFGLAEKDNIYYEQFIGNQWVAKSRARIPKSENGLY